jgi:hypothetical protein
VGRENEVKKKLKGDFGEIHEDSSTSLKLRLLGEIYKHKTIPKKYFYEIWKMDLTRAIYDLLSPRTCPIAMLLKFNH